VADADSEADRLKTAPQTMAPIRFPGPMDVLKLGDDWIDRGTLIRTRSEPAGPVRSNPARLACMALASMIRSTQGICRMAGEDSVQCEQACATARARVNQLLTQCKLDLPQITFKEHRTSGSACGTQATLGVGKFGLTNAAELVFYVDPYARCFFSDYEVRRTVEDKTYERVTGTWRVVATTGAGTDDSPPPRTDHPKCMQPPELHSFDSPGFVFNVRELPVGGGKKVSSNATEVDLRMNFLESIEAKGPSVRITTDQIKWSNVLKLKWDGKAWKIQPGSAIALGHVVL
jgi:hypothetical protein